MNNPDVVKFQIILSDIVFIGGGIHTMACTIPCGNHTCRKVIFQCPWSTKSSTECISKTFTLSHKGPVPIQFSCQKSISPFLKIYRMWASAKDLAITILRQILDWPRTNSTSQGCPSQRYLACIKLAHREAFRWKDHHNFNKNTSKIACNDLMPATTFRHMEYHFNQWNLHP